MPVIGMVFAALVVPLIGLAIVLGAIPAATGAAVTLAGVQSLTNKTISTSTISTGNTVTGALTFNDNVAATFGTGGDATIAYNGTDLRIDPDVVGSGNIDLLGNVEFQQASSIATTAGNLTLAPAGSTRVSSNLGVNVAPSATIQLLNGGSFAPAGGNADAFRTNADLTVTTGGGTVQQETVTGTMTLNGAIVTTRATTLRVDEPAITLLGGATVTDAATLYVAAAPTEGSTGNYAVWVDAGRVQVDGSIVVGAPTGGDKGAGTINAVSVYDDNVLLTDWVFDLYAGEPVRPGDDTLTSPVLYSLDDTYGTIVNDRHLPWFPDRDAFSTSPLSVGEMATRLWQGQEQQQLYIHELEQRISRLESLVGGLR